MLYLVHQTEITMNNSVYLQSKMEADRKIALSLESGINRLQKNGTEVLDSIYAGTERASWYSSCFFDNYKDICQELKEEDSRMITAIKEVFKRKDVILDMVEMYVDKLLHNFNDNTRKNIANQLTGFLGRNRSSLVTKSAITYSIALTISESTSFSIKTRTTINKVNYRLLTALDFYGKVQKAAMAARKLKSINPEYYYILYQCNIEMLYFIIEPALYKNIGRINSTISERDAIEILRAIIL